MFSGGVGSWAAAQRVVQEHGANDVVLLFTDTLIEDADLYRFLTETAYDLGATLVYLADGRDPWEVFHDVRFLGNHRIDPCSRILKRDLAKKWVKRNCDPSDTVLYVGIDWSEVHRLEAVKRNWEPYPVQGPMCEAPYLSKAQMSDLLKERGIEPPLLTKLGFPHNNCGGFCCKAGQAHFKHLLDVFPERYAEHEAKEQAMREYLDADVAFLTDRRNDERKPYTLKQFREEVQSTGQYDMHEWGGCGCFI